MRATWVAVMGAACAVRSGPPADTDVVDTDPHTDPSCCQDTEVADSDGCSGGPAFRIGTGAIDFEPITPGGNVTMTHGPQGGWHVNISFEADGVPQLVMLEWRLKITATGTVITTEDLFQARVALVPRDEGLWDCDGEYPGERAYLDYSKVPDAPEVDPWKALCGVPVTFEGDVRDPGRPDALGPILASDTVDFVLQPDPADGPPCDVVTASAGRP